MHHVTVGIHHVTVGIHHVTFGLAPEVSSHRQCIVYRDCRVTPDNDLNIVLSLTMAGVQGVCPL